MQFFSQASQSQGGADRKPIKAIGEAMPALKDRAVVEAKVAVSRCRCIDSGSPRGLSKASIGRFRRRRSDPDFFIFDSLPGAGAVMAPRLAARRFAAERYQRHRDANLLGYRPVTESSGKSSGFIFACLFEVPTAELSRVGRPSIPQSKWARAYYELQCAGQEAPCGGGGR